MFYIFSWVCVMLKPSLLTKFYVELDNNFRIYSRALLNLATSLHRARELRNLFVELAQILETWKQNNWSCQDMESFLLAYMKCAVDMDVLRYFY